MRVIAWMTVVACRQGHTKVQPFTAPRGATEPGAAALELDDLETMNKLKPYVTWVRLTPHRTRNQIVYNCCPEASCGSWGSLQKGHQQVAHRASGLLSYAVFQPRNLADAAGARLLFEVRAVDSAHQPAEHHPARHPVPVRSTCCQRVRLDPSATRSTALP